MNRQLNVTSICVTHDLASAYMISDRVAMVAERRIIAVGTSEELRRSDNPTVQEFLNAMNHDGPRAA